MKKIIGFAICATMFAISSSGFTESPEKRYEISAVEKNDLAPMLSLAFTLNKYDDIAIKTVGVKKNGIEEYALIKNKVPDLFSQNKIVSKSVRWQNKNTLIKHVYFSTDKTPVKRE